jgi:hypothetical protein
MRTVRSVPRAASVAAPAALLALVLLCGCGGGEAPAPPPPPAGSAASRLLLAADPGGGISVKEARAAAGTLASAGGDEVVVVGRVRDITAGHAAFVLVDASLNYCGEHAAEGCPEPWDYCCHAPPVLAAGSLGVRALEGGQLIAVEKLPGLRRLDLVAVRGRLVPEGKSVYLAATGWFRRERPTLPDGVRFPE